MHKKFAKESYTEMNELVLPNDTNTFGNLMGGRLLYWMDICSAMVKNKYHRGFILNVALIFAGALGNIIDSTFYGVLFSESSFYEKASFLPAGGGYAPLFHGKVVDMLYFPLIEGNFPEWFPFWGGEHFLFFRPVFNIADTAISIGVFLILLFQRRYFKEEIIEKESINSEVLED